MRLYIFRGPGRVFAATRDESGANLPVRYAPWAAFKTVDVQRGVNLPGLNSGECLDDIETYGFHVTDAHVRITQTLV